MIEIEGLEKVYGQGSTRVAALQKISLHIPAGDLVAIMGPSGSGKSTLMNIIGCLDRPTAGSYRLAGEEVANLTDNELAEVRNRRIGFIFQSFNLLPRLTALKNVELPLIYRGLGARERRQRSVEALTAVGLADRLHHRPNQLSGGQQQRVAIARALSGQPAILLGDEPTGNLDSRSGEEIIAIFQELNSRGNTVLIVTHDENIARHCSRVVRLRDGLIVDDRRVEQPVAAREQLAQIPHPGMAVS